MPFLFNSIFYLKIQRTIQVIHIKYQSKHSIHTSSKQSKQLCWLQFKYILIGQPIKLCTVANFINIHRTIFNWYYVTQFHLKTQKFIALLKFSCGKCSWLTHLYT